jgi:RND family efflux transporter MFP subunit
MRALADGSLVTRERLEAAEQDVLGLRQELSAAEARHRIAVLEAREAREAHARLTLTAPLDGVVTERHVDPGEFASEQAPVLSIAALDPLRVEAWIGAGYWGRVTAGDTATVRVSNAPEARHAARVTSVDPVMETVSETFRVTLELPNPDRSLPAGLPCRLELQGPAGE